MRKLAKLIIDSALGKSKTDNFWNMSATLLLSLIIEVVCAQEEQYRNMYNVANLIDVFSYKPQAIDKLVVAVGNPMLTSEYKSFNTYESRVLSSIIATLKSATELFKDDDIARVTAYDSIDIASYRNTPSILFVNSSISDLQYHSLISTIFFTQAFAEILSAIPPKKSLGIFLLLDEAASLTLQGVLPTVYAQIRKYFGGAMCCYQSQFQMNTCFSDAESKSIRESSYISEFLPGQSIQTSTEISAMLGDYDFLTSEGTKKSRRLLHPDEVRINENAIAFAGNMPGMQLKLTPFFKNRSLFKLTEIPPYFPDTLGSDYFPPLLPLD
jgi:type IV secretory pathway TraG/TraD family ATPase VirD4